MINLHERMLPTSAGVEPATSWSPVGRPGGHGFNPCRGRQHSFVEIDHEIFSTVILFLPLIQEGQLSVSGERMCTILVNVGHDLYESIMPMKVFLSKCEQCSEQCIPEWEVKWGSNRMQKGPHAVKMYFWGNVNSKGPDQPAFTQSDMGLCCPHSIIGYCRINGCIAMVSIKLYSFMGSLLFLYTPKSPFLMAKLTMFCVYEVCMHGSAI